MTFIEMVSFIRRVLQQRFHCISLPGRNPGTSSKVMRGILKASQNLTNLAPLMDEVISRHPIGGGGSERGGGGGGRGRGGETHNYTHQHNQAPPTCLGVGLIGHNTYCTSSHPSKLHNNVLSIVRHDLKEVSLIHNSVDDIEHIVRLV